MRTRDRLGLSIPPLLLRVVLALTFLWAGLGKIMAEAPVSGVDAVILAELGVIEPGNATPIPPADQLEPEAATPETPTPAAPVPEPIREPDAEPENASEPDADPAEPLADPESTTAQALAEHAGLFLPVAYRQVTFSPADFTEPVMVKRLYPGVVTRLVKAAEPGLDPQTSEPIKPIAPAWAAEKQVVLALGWAAPLTEAIAGALLLFGLLTRISAVSLVGVMVTAIWLDTIGPAWQAGEVVLGFIPNHDVFSFDWVKPLWQLLVLAATAGLMFSGAGALSLDRLFFGRKTAPSSDS
mgnify:CR=1 FL=1